MLKIILLLKKIIVSIKFFIKIFDDILLLCVNMLQKVGIFFLQFFNEFILFYKTTRSLLKNFDLGQLKNYLFTYWLLLLIILIIISLIIILFFKKKYRY